MEILFENQDYWIIRKPSGTVSESSNGKGLADLLAARNHGYVGVIHRLDREVSGLMLYAKTPSAAARFSASSDGNAFRKEYLAAVSGTLDSPEGELSDLLFYDRSKNKVFPVSRRRQGVRKAVLRYRVEEVLETAAFGKVSLVSVEPVTGRTHQIRVQFASRGHSVVGDRRYGGVALPPDFEKGQILLCCRRLYLSSPDGLQTFASDPDWLLVLRKT